MDLPDAAPPAQTLDIAGSGAGLAPDRGSASADLRLDSWVELLVHGQWVRTQLTWISSHGNLFLFTSAAGESQSMTRRSRDKLIAAGHLRVLSGAPVVDGALNAVAQMAMHNSVNSMF
jgi:hypothetical protein